MGAVMVRVYPRVCGGTRRPRHLVGKKSGLSPRVRGNRNALPCGQPSMRSIPACAGEPDCRAMCSSSIKVYPRVCGGTDCGVYYDFRGYGLSPRVRGNPLQAGEEWGTTRSIPACAGEPVKGERNEWTRRVYPRVCGGTPWRFNEMSGLHSPREYY